MGGALKDHSSMTPDHVCSGVDKHLVRDEGVAGSNPATPTNISLNRSKSFPTGARPFAGGPGQISGQKRRAGLSSPPAPENDTPRAATLTPLQAIRTKCLWCCNGSKHEVALCKDEVCPSWPFQFGRKPTAEQRDTALKAIKRKCLDCSGGAKSEVRNCARTDCALHPFRQGKNPNRAYSPEERARRSQHLAKLKIARALPEKPVSIGDPRTESPGATHIATASAARSKRGSRRAF